MDRSKLIGLLSDFGIVDLGSHSLESVHDMLAKRQATALQSAILKQLGRASAVILFGPQHKPQDREALVFRSPRWRLTSGDYQQTTNTMLDCWIPLHRATAQRRSRWVPAVSHRPWFGFAGGHFCLRGGHKTRVRF